MGNGNAMLEVYSAGNMQSPDYQCGIWIPIIRIDETSEIVKEMTMIGKL